MTTPWLRQVGIAFVVLALCILGWGELTFRTEVDREGQFLESVAAEVAAHVDAGEHESINGPQDEASPAFLSIRGMLREAQERRGIESPIYTLRPTVDGGTEFVVMTNETAFIGDAYVLRPAMRPVLDNGDRARTGLYGDDHGRWVSAYAPIKTADGAVVALVEVDRPADALVAGQTSRRLVGLLGSLLGALLLGALQWMFQARRGPLAALKRLIVGRLAVRIGLAGSAAVVVAVGIAGWLDHHAARAELVSSLSKQLMTAVSVGAPLVDPDLHDEVARTGDPRSPAFIELQGRLRRLQESAHLESPVYTLRKDRGATRFVVMTNETPYIGDLQELRPGVAETFATGQPGSEGPYTNATDTWISAWAPICDARGAVIAVVQADHPVGTLLLELTNRSLRRLLFALAGIGLAFAAAAVLARNIAQPIRAIAEAAVRIGQGDLDVRVSEDRIDEVGELARAVNQMAHGLREREKLRDMFGKYMASQVVSELMDRGEISLEGEAREVTVLLSDIRGYTALTEELGATEVVALLNEYFTILVDCVIAEEGVVDKFMGDAMLCWFGAPVPAADHRERAVRAGVRIMERLGVWNAERVARGLEPVGTGIGTACGKVVVGNIGSPQFVEYTAIGDTVNLASRLCSKAQAGELIVTNYTRTVCEGAGVMNGRFVEIGPVTLKGVADAVTIHKIVIPTVIDGPAA